MNVEHQARTEHQPTRTSIRDMLRHKKGSIALRMALAFCIWMAVHVLSFLLTEHLAQAHWPTRQMLHVSVVPSLILGVMSGLLWMHRQLQGVDQGGDDSSSLPQVWSVWQALGDVNRNSQYHVVRWAGLLFLAWFSLCNFLRGIDLMHQYKQWAWHDYMRTGFFLSIPVLMLFSMGLAYLLFRQAAKKVLNAKRQVQRYKREHESVVGALSVDVPASSQGDLSLSQHAGQLQTVESVKQEEAETEAEVVLDLGQKARQEQALKSQVQRASSQG